MKIQKSEIHISGENEFKYNTSTLNLSLRSKLIHEKIIQSCSNLTILIDTSKKINIKRQLALLGKLGDLLGEAGEFLTEYMR